MWDFNPAEPHLLAACIILLCTWGLNSLPMMSSTSLGAAPAAVHSLSHPSEWLLSHEIAVKYSHSTPRVPIQPLALLLAVSTALVPTHSRTLRVQSTQTPRRNPPSCRHRGYPVHLGRPSYICYHCCCLPCCSTCGSSGGFL